MKRRRALWMLAVFVGLVVCAAAVGSLWTEPSSEWYLGLAKPAWRPPDWVFGPVWTALYLMMAVAAWLVWRRSGWGGARLPLLLWVHQLVLNAAWSPVFFGTQSPGLGFAVIVLLWCILAATVVAFWRVSRWAGALLIPYQVWVTYAAVLNFAIWRLNS